MTDINERLYEIQKMIEHLIKEEDKPNLKEIYRIIDWKRECHQEEIRKLDDIFYFLSGVLFSKGITCSWGTTKFKEEKLKEANNHG